MAERPYSGSNLGPLQPTGGGSPVPGTGADPYADHFLTEPPKDAVAPTAAAPDDKTYDNHFLSAPPDDAPPAPSYQFGKAESAIKGLGNSLTFGASPALAGLAEASGMPSEAGPGGADMNPARPIVGAYKMIHEWLSDHPDPEVKAAYERGRKAQQGDETAAADQHPAAYIGGQLAGALATPLGAVGAAGKAASVVKGIGNVERGVKAGAIGGGLFGAGGAVGEGKNNPGEIALEAGKGALVGGAVGGAASGLVEGIGAGASKIASMYRAKNNPDVEAARLVVQKLTDDYTAKGRKIDPEAAKAGRDAGTPISVIDAGGEGTKALGEWAATTSARGREVLKDFLEPRFEQQAHRISGAIRRLGGGAHAAQDQEALQLAARLHNKPAYDRLMDAHPVVNVPSNISDRPAVAQAMKDAVSLAKNHGEQIVGPAEVKTILSGDGYHIADDVANPAKTSLRYWDYVKKAMDARIKGMERSGGIQELNSKEVADLRGLMDARTALVTHLDSVAKDYKATRQGAARFFGAEDASEAGQKFVTEEFDSFVAKRALASMSAPERELFARAFASELANKVAKTSFSGDVLKSAFLNNGPARDKIRLALGPQRADQLEALLRIEKIAADPMSILNGSPTARRIYEMIAGAGAVGTFESVKDQKFTPTALVHALIAGVVVGGLHHGVKVIDERAAHSVAKLLVSNDSGALTKGVKILAARPHAMNALREITSGTARVGVHDLGPGNVAAGSVAVGTKMFGSGGSEQSHTNPADAAADQVQ